MQRNIEETLQIELTESSPVTWASPREHRTSPHYPPPAFSPENPTFHYPQQRQPYKVKGKKKKENPKTDQHTEPKKEKRDKFDENEDLWLGFGLRLRKERRLGCGVLRIGYRGRRGRW